MADTQVRRFSSLPAYLDMGTWVSSGHPDDEMTTSSTPLPLSSYPKYEAGKRLSSLPAYLDMGMWVSSGHPDDEMTTSNMPLPLSPYPKYEPMMQAYAPHSSVTTFEQADLLRVFAYPLPTIGQIEGELEEENTYLSVFLFSWLFSGASGKAAELEEELVIQFGRFDQVDSIYLLDLPEITQVFITIDQLNYNDALMDQLLDDEAMVLDRFPHRLFRFHYFPLPKHDSPLPVPDKALLIYR